MYDRPVLDIDDALKIIDAAINAAPGKTSEPLAVSVVDDRGDWVAFVATDGTPVYDREQAKRKAYTAAIIRQDLSQFAAARPRPISDLGDPRLVGAAHGGLIIKDPSGSTIGALGISSGSPEEDQRIAQAALAAAPVAAGQA